MYKQLWHDIHRSVCSITFLQNESRISSGSGFRVGKRIITNNHVIQTPPACTDVSIRFVQADSHSTKKENKFPIRVFKNRLLEGDSKEGWDFAIMEVLTPLKHKLSLNHNCAESHWKLKDRQM